MPELKIDCGCRKPRMLIKAVEDFNIDLKNSWMVGDGKNGRKSRQSGWLPHGAVFSWI